MRTKQIAELSAFAAVWRRVGSDDREQVRLQLGMAGALEPRNHCAVPARPPPGMSKPTWENEMAVVLKGSYILECASDLFCGIPQGDCWKCRVLGLTPDCLNHPSPWVRSGTCVF